MAKRADDDDDDDVVVDAVDTDDGA